VPIDSALCQSTPRCANRLCAVPIDSALCPSTLRCANRLRAVPIDSALCQLTPRHAAKRRVTTSRHAKMEKGVHEGVEENIVMPMCIEKASRDFYLHLWIILNLVSNRICGEI
jgi:hypothetical protein